MKWVGREEAVASATGVAVIALMQKYSSRYVFSEIGKVVQVLRCVSPPVRVVRGQVFPSSFSPAVWSIYMRIFTR